MKFCDGPPRVHVAAEQTGKEWVFSVRDNGIGIARSTGSGSSRFPAAARARRVPWYGDRAGDLPEGGAAAREPDLGRISAGPGEHLLLHHPSRGRETIMTIRESPRSPGLFSTAMCPVGENVAIMQSVCDDQGHPMTRDTRDGGGGGGAGTPDDQGHHRGAGKNVGGRSETRPDHAGSRLGCCYHEPRARRGGAR